MKIKNNTLQQIGRILSEAGTILLYTHVSMDGDTLGSSVALCKALRKAGKEAYVLIEDTIPAYLNFLDNSVCTFNEDVLINPDVSIAIDCSDMERFPKRIKKFQSAKKTVCIDHHPTNRYFADLNYVDDFSSSTGELIYALIKEMGITIDREIAEPIYTAIVTDTGNFQYTNTTKSTHLITAELFDVGIELEKISVALYQNMRFEKLKITNEVIQTIELFSDGKGIIAYASQEMLQRTGASLDETEGIIETLRNISGVEIACFLKEHEEKIIKVSFRAKTNGNVAEIAQSLGGGGHKKAAGCTIHATLEEARELIKKTVEPLLKSYEQMNK